MVQALTGPKLDRDLIEFFKLDTLGCQVLDPNGYGPGRTADYYFPAYGVIAEKKELRALIPPASRREKKDPVGNMVGREVFWDSLRVSLTMDRAYYSSSMNIVAKRMRSANKQIGITKAKLDVPSAKGLMIIVSEENFFTAHEICSEFCKRATHHLQTSEPDRFPNIDAGIFIWRSRIYHAVGRGPEPAISVHSYKGEDQTMNVFCDRLCRGWTAFLDDRRRPQASA